MSPMSQAFHREPKQDIPGPQEPQPAWPLRAVNLAGSWVEIVPGTQRQAVSFGCLMMPGLGGNFIIFSVRLLWPRCQGLLVGCRRGSGPLTLRVSSACPPSLSWVL